MSSYTAALSELEGYVRTDSNVNLPRTQSLIKDLKFAVASLQSLDPSTKTLDTNELLFARKFEELLVYYSLQTRNIPEFETSVKRLKVIYDDFRVVLPKSSDQNNIVAIYLLYLLSFNKISEFHSSLEIVPYEDFSFPSISFVISMERALMEGNYNHVMLMKASPPLPQFQVFLDRILETIRFEIARSSEKAYKRLLISDSLKIFHLNSEQELVNYIKSQEKFAEEQGIKWRVEGLYINFESLDDGRKKIEADHLIQTMLHYSNELEKIV